MGQILNDAPLITIDGSDNKSIIQFILLVANLLSAYTHFMIMEKPNKTASDLTACSIPTHAVMMHITKTSLENWKRKVIPEIFSTDNSNSFHISNWCQYTTNWCWYWWFQVFWISYFTWDIFDGMENNSIHTAEENKSHRTLHLTIKMDIDIKKLSCFIVPGDRKRKPTIIV